MARIYKSKKQISIKKFEKKISAIHPATDHQLQEAAGAIFTKFSDIIGKGSLKLAFPRTNSSYMFYVYKGKKIDSVIKAFDIRDISASKIMSPKIIDVPGAVPQIRVNHRRYTLIWREFVEQPMTADKLACLSTSGDIDPSKTAKVVTEFISKLLQAISNLHERNIVHGALQPDSISIEDDGAIRIRDIGVPPYFKKNLHAHTENPNSASEFNDDYIPRRYVPRERLINPELPPTASGDIWAFFSLALDALRPYRGSRAYEELESLDGKIRWLKECFDCVPKRPGASLIQKLLFGDFTKYQENLFRQINQAVDKIAVVMGKNRATSAASRIVTYFKKYPETNLAMSTKGRSKQIRRLFALIDSRRPKVYDRFGRKNDFYYVNAFSAKENMELQKKFIPEQFPPEIDSLWKDQIHEDYFGFPLDSVHELRISATELSEEDQMYREMYLESVRHANEARAQLLEENQFLTTAGAIEELDGGKGRFSREDVLIARRWGTILAVPDHKRWLYPIFQFNDGRISSLVGLLHDMQTKHLDGAEPDPWDLLTFFSVRRKLLGGLALKDCLWEKGSAKISRYIIENALL